MKKLNLILTLVFALIFSVNSFAANNSDGFSVGEKVSDFTIINYDDTQYTLSNSGANYTVLIFLSTQCPFVQPYSERLNNLVKEFGSNGVTIWGINSNKTEPVDEIKTHSADHGYTFPVLKDNNNVVADLFGAERTPEVFVVRNSDMSLVYHGRIDDDKDADKVSVNDLQNALNDLNSGKEVAVTNTKAFGCTIKR
ncbi:MAG: redoxin domain-containing protein [Ignavibacteria bacterium]|nr:redoxin domain-containing protein [Ignavibacteria bacterium]